MAHMVRRDPSYKRGLPKPKESPAYLTDFKNYDCPPVGTSRSDLNKAALRDEINAMVAAYNGTVTKWPKEHRILPRWTTVSVPGANETKPTRT